MSDDRSRRPRQGAGKPRTGPGRRSGGKPGGSSAGRKPEGLSRAAEGEAITVVFDAGAGLPQWTEQPWPAR